MSISELLKRFPGLEKYMENLPPDLEKEFITKEFPSKHVIHQKDSLLEVVSILCEGTIRVINEFDNGNAFMIETVEPIDVIGDVTLLARRQRTSVTIETITPVIVLQFTREKFEYWLDQDLSLLRLISQNVSSKLHNSSYTRGIEVFYSSPRLMMDFLNQTAQDYFSDTDEDTMRLGDTRQELSEKIGMTRKTVDRTIIRLKELGLIDTIKGKIILNRQQLKMIQTRLAEWIS